VIELFAVAGRMEHSFPIRGTLSVSTRRQYPPRRDRSRVPGNFPTGVPNQQHAFLARFSRKAGAINPEELRRRKYNRCDSNFPAAPGKNHCFGHVRA